MSKQVIFSAGFVAVITIISGGKVAADQPSSIIGTWALPGLSCARDDGALTIGAKSLDGADVSCRFATVRREGRTVIWAGVCSDAEGESQQTVTATERNGRLTLRYTPGGSVLRDFRRCP